VHAPSWISRDLRQVYDRELGEGWMERPPDPARWAALGNVSDEDLWQVHERRRERLVRFVRWRLQGQARARGAGAAEVAAAGSALDPKILTIGFARRFATYKRATLVLSDPERLAKILNDPARPAQIVFAGKAHPRDEGGKELIKQVQVAAATPELRGKIVFLENYDVVVARAMLSGCDVWLNTPRRPLEASGTSGMKAALNGAVNLSILDGWWDEAAGPGSPGPDAGFVLGGREEFADIQLQDKLEGRSIYDRIEQEVAPLFYARGPGGVPAGWVALMKRGITQLGPVYNTARMVSQYLSDAYLPALHRVERLEADGHARARAIAAWRAKVRGAWKDVRLTSVESNVPGVIGVGSQFDVKAWVRPGGLAAEDLRVELCLGRVGRAAGAADEILSAVERVPMRPDGTTSDLGILYHARVSCPASGVQGFTVRVTPQHEDLGHPQEMGLMAWAG
jgi:starch phosphorylase